jgi:MinD superfamily P-loop ATPase
LDEVLPIEIFPLPNKYKRCKKLEVICDGEVLKVENEKRGEVKIKKDFTPSFGNYKLNLISGSIDEGKTGSGKVVEGVIEAAGQFEAQIQILDSAPGTGYPVLTPLKESDFAILITEPTVLGFSDLKKLVAITKNNNKFGVVINKESLNPELGKEIEIWSSPNFLGRIDFFPEIEENLKNKVPPTLKKSKISKQIENIYHLILNQAKDAHL